MGLSEILSQDDVDLLLAKLKVAIRETAFAWNEGTRYEERMISAQLNGMEFILFLNRNPFEIRLHLRTKDHNIGLCRIDNAPYHCNPDGSEIRRQPHFHRYRENHGLDFAEPIDWYGVDNPIETLRRFLMEINAIFPKGFQRTLI